MRAAMASSSAGVAVPNRDGSMPAITEPGMPPRAARLAQQRQRRRASCRTSRRRCARPRGAAAASPSAPRRAPGPGRRVLYSRFSAQRTGWPSGVTRSRWLIRQRCSRVEHAGHDAVHGERRHARAAALAGGGEDRAHGALVVDGVERTPRRRRLPASITRASAPAFASCISSRIRSHVVLLAPVRVVLARTARSSLIHQMWSPIRLRLVVAPRAARGRRSPGTSAIASSTEQLRMPAAADVVDLADARRPEERSRTR